MSVSILKQRIYKTMCQSQKDEKKTFGIFMLSHNIHSLKNKVCNEKLKIDKIY
jgi:hypothetical protein